MNDATEQGTNEETTQATAGQDQAGSNTTGTDAAPKTDGGDVGASSTEGPSGDDSDYQPDADSAPETENEQPVESDRFEDAKDVGTTTTGGLEYGTTPEGKFYIAKEGTHTGEELFREFLKATDKRGSDVPMLMKKTWAEVNEMVRFEDGVSAIVY